MLEDDEYSIFYKVEKNVYILFWKFIFLVFFKLYKNMCFRKQVLFVFKFFNIFLGEVVVIVFIIFFGVLSYKYVLFYRQYKMKVRGKLKLRRIKRDELGFLNLIGIKLDDDLILEEFRGND